MIDLNLEANQVRLSGDGSGWLDRGVLREGYFQKRWVGVCSSLPKTITLLGQFHFLSAPPPPPPPLMEGNLSRRTFQNIFSKKPTILSPCMQTSQVLTTKKTRVSESILPSRDAKNNWNCQILYCKKTVRQVVNFSDLGSSKINPRLCFTVQFQPKSSYM